MSAATSMPSFLKRNVLFSKNARPQINKVAIIGGGVAGLQAARALQRIGKDVTIFEKNDDFGGVWHHNYDGASLQVELELYQFPEYLYKQHEPKQCGLYDFPRLSIVKQYIQGYGKRFDLYKHARFNTKVSKIVPSVDTKDTKKQNSVNGWFISSANLTNNKESKEEFYDYLCVCTGMYNNPNMTPMHDIDGINEYKGNIIHSSQFINMNDKLKDKKVSMLVYGGGKSAFDIVSFGCRNGNLFNYPIHWFVHKPQWTVSAKYLNLVKLKLFACTRFGASLAGHFGVALKDYSFLRKIVQPPFWRFMELFTIFEFNLHKNKMQSYAGGKHNIWKDCFGGGIILNRKSFEEFGNGKVEYYSGMQYGTKIQKYDSKEEKFILENNTSIPYCDLMIFATGFDKHHYNEIFDKNTIDFDKAFNVESDGIYLYKQILPSKVDRIAFIGSEATSFSNVLTSFIQSEWLASAMKGTLSSTKQMDEMTDEQQMDHIENEISQIKEYKRSFMNDTPNRAASIQLHMNGYHDLLLQDMGLNPKRKSNIVFEMINPIIASDYSSIANEKPI